MQKNEISMSIKLPNTGQKKIQKNIKLRNKVKIWIFGPSSFGKKSINSPLLKLEIIAQYPMLLYFITITLDALL